MSENSDDAARDPKAQRLSPSKQNKLIPTIYGYDTETHGQKNDFVIGSIYRNDGTSFVSTNRNDIIKEIAETRKGIWIACTNLAFDFNATFWKSKAFSEFKPVEKDGNLLWTKSYMSQSGEFSYNKKSRNDFPVMFIDTMNYAKMSVESLGKLINLPKLSSVCGGRISTFEYDNNIGVIEKNPLWRRPETKTEWDEMTRYVVRDSEITQKGTSFLHNSFRELGGNIKPTLAQVGLSIWTNGYLKRRLYTHDRTDLDFELQALHGGRVEAIHRGHIEGRQFFIDVNSMYPYVMMANAMPDPNTLRKPPIPELHHITDFEGISDVTIEIPPMQYPPIPYYHGGKLLFPYGTIRAVLAHAEIQYAISLGCSIKQIHTCYYCAETFYPFTDFVKDIYGKRQKWEQEKDPRAPVAKITLNGTYGKLNQRYGDTEEYVPLQYATIEDMVKFDKQGIFLRVTKSRDPARFCIPMIGAQITAHSRILLHKTISKEKSLYHDTDSALIRNKIDSSTELGKFKVEKVVDDCFIRAPKLYALHDEVTGKWSCKSKGMPRMPIDMWKHVAEGESLQQKIFMKFRGAIVRKKTPNEIITMTKTLKNQDSKREWLSDFSLANEQKSVPLKIIDGSVQNENTFDTDTEEWTHSGFRFN